MYCKFPKPDGLKPDFAKPKPDPSLKPRSRARNIWARTSSTSKKMNNAVYGTRQKHFSGNPLKGIKIYGPKGLGSVQIQ